MRLDRRRMVSSEPVGSSLDVDELDDVSDTTEACACGGGAGGSGSSEKRTVGGAGLGGSGAAFFFFAGDGARPSLDFAGEGPPRLAAAALPAGIASKCTYFVSQPKQARGHLSGRVSFFPTAASPRLLRHIDRQGVGRSQHAGVFYPDATFLTQTADSMVRSSFWRHRCVHSSCLRGLLAPLPFPASVPLLFARRPRHAVGYRRLTTVPLVRVVLAG